MAESRSLAVGSQIAGISQGVRQFDQVAEGIDPHLFEVPHVMDSGE
jgi:hypothetical protein